MPCCAVVPRKTRRHLCGRAGQGQNGSEDRPNTGRPSDGEGKPDQHRAHIAGRALTQLQLHAACEIVESDVANTQ
jgi:hypothetical protein